MKHRVVITAIIALIATVVAYETLRPRTFYCPASRTSRCKNNLKWIGLALHNYHDAYGAFPPAYLTDSHGRPAHSWRILILPFLDSKEYEELYRQYRFDEPWNGPNNAKLADLIPEAYRCPSDVARLESENLQTPATQQKTNYVVFSTPQSVLSGSRSKSLDDVVDGISETAMVGETCDHAVHWMEPRDVAPDDLYTELHSAAEPSQTNHHLGLHVLLVDGSIRFIPAEIERSAFDALVTADGNEEIDTK